MQVLFSPSIKEYIKLRLEAGDFDNASELVNEAIELMQEQEAEANKKQRLIEALDVGYNDFLEGRHKEISAKEILDELIEKTKR